MNPDNNYNHPLNLLYLNMILREIWSNPRGYVILDTETTGLDRNAEIIEMAIVDLEGAVLLDKRFDCLSTEIPCGATACHGMVKKDLISLPRFADKWDTIAKIIDGKTVIIYNADYDLRLIEQSLDIQNKPASIDINYVCLMLLYAIYCGEWNSFFDGYKWQKLEGDHSALGDCKKVLYLLETMRDFPKSLPLNFVSTRQIHACQMFEDVPF